MNFKIEVSINSTSVRRTLQFLSMSRTLVDG